MARHTGHSWPSEVLSVASVNGIQRLILTHFNPMMAGLDPVGLGKVLDNPGTKSPPLVELAQDYAIYDLH
jgi:ribonuclease BN (tRNA processing enzyme)